MRAIPDLIQLCKEALKHYPMDLDILRELKDGEDLYSSHVAAIEKKLLAQGLPLEEYAWGMLPIKLSHGLHLSYEHAMHKRWLGQT